MATKKTVKKTAAKSAKKAARKKAAKNTVRSSAAKKTVKKAPRKTVRKRSRAREIKKTATKNEVGTIKIHDETRSRVSKEKKAAKKKVTETALSKDRVQLAALTPLRFPVQYDHLLSQTARLSGMAFVVLGALFLLLNLQASNADSVLGTGEVHTAATLDATATTTYDTTTQETEPSVTFEINDPEPLSGVVTVQYSVPGAESVAAAAFYKDGEQYLKLGPASHVGGDTWQFAWDTTRYRDGEYRMKALVTNGYGTYEDSDGSYVLVNNTIDSTTTTTDGGTNSTTETTSTDTQPTVDFLIDADQPLRDIVTVYYTVESADAVKAAAYYKDGGERVTLGEAAYVDGNKWVYRWDTTQYHDGEYKLQAVVANAHGTYEDSDSSYVLVDNTTDDLVTTTEDILNETVNEEPAAQIAVVRDDRAVEEVTLMIEVAIAERVEVFAEHQDTLRKDSIGKAFYDGADTWKVLWDTEGFDTGEYALFAEIDNAYGSYIGGHTSFFLERETNTQIDESTTTETTNDDPILVEETDDPVETLTPSIRLEIPDAAEMTDKERVAVFVDEAKFVELYAVQNFGNTEYFLGLARHHGGNEWRFEMDTTQIPNGKYGVFARVKNSFGLYDSEPTFVYIQNETDHENTFKEELYIEEIKESTEAATATTTDTDDTTEETRQSLLQSAEASGTTDAETELEEALHSYEEKLQALMEDLARAIREEDADKITALEEKIEDLRSDVLSEIGDTGLSEDLLTEIDHYLTEVAEAERKRVEQNEKILRERVGEDIFKDSDNDSISDYDEVNLYGTDPFSADTDGDGFIDGAEIQRGFDPLNSEAEALVAHESPKERGVVREDILKVESITGMTRDPADTASDGVVPVAIISGKALPNSFVTLYIFSTPIVVTVKTGDDGSWSYTFDKELPDGEHEVYAGVTDNAGRIVAKSLPLGFIKTAEAFTQVDASGTAKTVPTDTSAPAILSQNMVLAISSGVVVVFGLILLLLGLHVREQQPNVAVQ